MPTYRPRLFDDRAQQNHAAGRLTSELSHHLRLGDDDPTRGELPRLAAVVRLLVRLSDAASVEDVDDVRLQAEELFPEWRRGGRDDPALVVLRERLLTRRNLLKGAGVEVVETDETRRESDAVQAVVEAVAKDRL